MSSVRECPRCRARYGEADEFCSADGAPLQPAAEAAPRPQDPQALLGQVVGGRFLLTALLGQSDTAAMYRATHRLLERDFAVKILRRGFQRDRSAVARFLREAKVASSVDHPNIVNIYDFGQSEQGEPYLVMEYVEGVMLAQVIAASPGRKLPVSQAVDLLLQVARALQHAHQRGVVHRNIKPENIALTHRDGHADFVKVLDLGVARIVGHPALTQRGELVGTPEFLAPEAWSEEPGEVAPPVDLYAFGVLLHCAIAGRPPFVGERGELMLHHLQSAPPLLSVHSRSAEVPKQLDELTQRLLDKDPAQRPSADALVACLERVHAQLPPPSLRSLLLQKTLILPAKPPPPPPSWAQATMITHRAARETVVHGRTEALAETFRQQLGAMLSQIDALEAEVERARRRLAESADALGRRLWPARWPPEPEALRAHITALEETEEALGIQLAVTEERLRQHEHEVHERRAALRQEVLALSERLRGGPVQSGRLSLEGIERSGLLPVPLLGEERQETLDRLMEAERAYAATAEVDDGGLAEQRDQERAGLQAVRNDLHDSWLKLARLVAAAAPVGDGERRRIEGMLEQLEAAALALQKLSANAQNDW